ncbi:MAG: c-type cytochrome domain-containing protein, partial [Pirellulaceae bacterium]|nr:c-type cytochrome domain-containing protein [Pirellulaceae bacterium]
MRTRGHLTPVAIGLMLTLCSANWGLADEIDFNRDIRPILADKCFACHGPDAHALQGGLRLDLFSSVTSPSDSGETAIVPGQPARSELFLRITSHDVAVIMPPPDSHKEL